MDILRNIGIALLVMVGIYLSIFLAYLLIPVTIFSIVYFIVKTIRDIEESELDE